ncbi:hypothetical protein [Serratia marcescens]|uniref:hypothetical protein n=1 Tax=Serratia marcescens TaxID=615 RepID=UPI000D72835C|nr:hypothetical protein [Serratia marcescens]AWQ49222.1 hypothetical protein B1A42_18515 [Serratia marcescens]
MKNIVENQCIKTDKPLPMSYEALKAERDALQKRADELAVENKAQADALSLISSCYGISPHIQSMCVVETPATSVALAEIKAQGLDELANACDGYAENHVYTFTKRHAEEFAANLREAK